MKKWMIAGLVLATFFAVYEVVTSGTRFVRFPLPTTTSLVDSTGKECYQYVVPVSAKEKTYLMVVSYTHGFDETQERFKIYYVWYKSLDNEPLKVEVYNDSGIQRASSQVRFYRQSTQGKCPITVLFPLDKENKYPAKTWLFTPPRVFPSELAESDVEKNGFRQYHEWIPPFER
jgi:hypothetical protein